MLTLFLIWIKQLSIISCPVMVIFDWYGSVGRLIIALIFFLQQPPGIANCQARQYAGKRHYVQRCNKRSVQGTISGQYSRKYHRERPHQTWSGNYTLIAGLLVLHPITSCLKVQLFKNKHLLISIQIKMNECKC